MTEIVFQLVQRPDGKWRLDHGNASYGPFDTQAQGEEAIERVRNPVIRSYNAAGEIIQ